MNTLEKLHEADSIVFIASLMGFTAFSALMPNESRAFFLIAFIAFMSALSFILIRNEGFKETNFLSKIPSYLISIGIGSIFLGTFNYSYSIYSSSDGFLKVLLGLMILFLLAPVVYIAWKKLTITRKNAEKHIKRLTK